MPRVRQARVDGSNVLYHYLQKELLATDVSLFQVLVARLVTALGVWFPPSVYSRMPILLPFALRDPACRGDKKRGIPDQWGSPDAAGYFRDDNSLLKSLPRSLQIEGSHVYQGRRLGKGFVASHVWRELTDPAKGQLASRDPLTYSFVPNIVWLPAQVAKLSDREGSFVQQYLQAISRYIYEDVQVRPEHKDLAEQAWQRLPAPAGFPAEGLPTVSELSFFEPNPSFWRTRIRRVRDVADALVGTANGRAPRSKVVAARYTEGLAQLDPVAAKSLGEALTKYVGEDQADWS